MPLLQRTSSRLISTSLGLLCGALLAAGCSSSEEKQLRWGRADEGIDPLNQELVVNGETIPDAVVRRELLYARGNTQLESKKLDVYLQQEIRRQIAEGADPEKFGIAREQVQKSREEALQKMRETYPDMTPEDVLGNNGMDMRLFTDSIEQTQLFDIVFLPDNPNDWPETTVALMDSSGGGAIVEQLRQSWEQREQAEQTEGPQPENEQGNAMWKTIMRQLVIQGLRKDVVVKTAVDGLPPEICMVVNGQEVRTDEMYDRISGLVTEEDLRRTRYWLAKTTALRQDLERSEHYLSDEEYAQAFTAHEEPYVGTPFPIEVIALGFNRFPSMDAYKRYFRLKESYERSIAAEITDEALRGHLERANPMLGLARVDTQVILCSAYDFKRGKWMEGGWERAAQRATEAAQKLAAGAEWDAILEEYSDYWDAPTPTNQAPGQPQPPQRKNKGRFGPQNRNELLKTVGESEYELFLIGSSITDHVFFDQEPGTIAGPLKGVHGWYITRVVSRTQPAQEMSLEDEQKRSLVEQDYLSCRFNEYAEEVLREASVQGVDVPY